MKILRISGFFAVALVVLLLCTSAAKTSLVEISFQYARQQTPGSNQYAVWIEDASGKLVKTLFVTNFTTKGRARGNEKAVRGFVFRPACVPQWVKVADAVHLTDEALDAYSGATPAADGPQRFVWDFTDQAGKTVPQGEYTVRVEATLLNEHAVLFTGKIKTDQAAEVDLAPVYTQPDNNQYKQMITQVKAVVK